MMKSFAISFYSCLFIFLLCLSFTEIHAQEVFDTLITTQRIVILFDSDSHAVKPQYLDSLKNIVAKSQNLDKFQITLSAHTDDVGSTKYNELLALKRMKSAEKALLDLNIKIDNIVSSAHGESLPLFKILNEKNRSLNRRVEVDLQTFQKVKRIVTKVIDSSSGDVVSAAITVKSFGLESYYESDEIGQVDILYPLTQNITIESQAENYFFKTLNLKSSVIQKLDTIVIKMSPLKIGSKFSLDKLNFVSNRCILIPNSLPILLRLRDFMKINREKCIEISGHINLPNRPPVDTAHVYYDLSVSRANVIYDSLRLYGIPKNRMYTKGYGNWEMKFPKATDKFEQAQNRRVEISIKDCDYVQQQMNGVVKQPKYHGYIKANKKYDPRTIEFDLKGVDKSYVDRINDVILFLQKQGKDPEDFSYAQLIKIK